MTEFVVIDINAARISKNDAHCGVDAGSTPASNDHSLATRMANHDWPTAIAAKLGIAA